MKSNIALVSALASLTNAFPGNLPQLEARYDPTASLKKRVVFDAAAQYVDTTGTHAFVAPGATDQRGPCPGLNAMANHGYLPHNGIATIDDLVTQVPKVFGMGADLAGILAVYGAVLDGDLTSYSIGGPDSRVGLSLLGLNLLSQPTGLTGSHNNYEGDASAVRGDLYQYGNNYLSQVSQFQALYDLGKSQDSYDVPLVTKFRSSRLKQSVANNPYYVHGPFAGVVAQGAAYAFIHRLMGNKSETYPEGRTNGEILKTFYAMSGDSGSFSYTPGHERLPDNWYKCNALDQYTTAAAVADIAYMQTQDLNFASLGGNMGTTNSFVGLDPANLTGGVYNAGMLAQGNNAVCFAIQLTIQALPGTLAGLFSDITAALSKVAGVLGTASSSLGCPQITNVDKKQLEQFPGYSKSYDGYHGLV
ncbi:hypothetical protein LTR62_005950 [Meristemomyces frigidus]|uniref:Heme haloperoxidase family profile domain-containing protein n=1 Tax=Meristemomyces frigidus TaxID=1508187 RepID=A0AAN7THH1_9PEZI|nr:hypothetical protein LTR62_005950 [Meristemomyces frigidus]